MLPCGLEGTLPSCGPRGCGRLSVGRGWLGSWLQEQRVQSPSWVLLAAISASRSHSIFSLSVAESLLLLLLPRSTVEEAVTGLV